MKKEIGYVENNTLPSNIYDKIYKEFIKFMEKLKFLKM